MNKAGLAAGLTALMLLSACSLAPEYKTPEVPVPTAYKETAPWQLAAPADQAPRGDWWRQFGDPTLDMLEARVDAGNPDLAAALAHYENAKAFAAQLNASLFPEIDASGSATRNRESDNRPLRGAHLPNVYDADTLGLSASYEIDLWGRVHNLVATGTALKQASGADLESVRLSLHGELANAYFQMRSADTLEKLLEDTAQDYQRQFELVGRRHQEGIVSGVDVSRADTQVDEVRAQISNLLARRALFEHEIAALVGQPASNLSVEPAVVEIFRPDIPAGVPSKLLQRRPDIAAAERRVAAANAGIGLARAAFFPTLDLGLAGGFQSTTTNGLLTAPNTFWSIGPSALLAVFDAGRRDALVAQARAQTDEAAAQYRSTVLRAFKEVEDNLALLRRQRDEMRDEAAAVAAAEHTYQLALSSYREGVVSYLEVVDADAARLRTRAAAQDISTRGLLATVALIRSLGGGWQGLGSTLAVSQPDQASAAPGGAGKVRD